MPVICTSTGARCAGNHVAMTRSTLGKTAASPAPMRTRARMPTLTTSANAMTPWPMAMRIMPSTMIGRAPNLSSSSPTGICITPYTASWMTANIDSAEASASNLTCASTPTDEREVRLMIATMYARSPTVQTVQVRQPGASRPIVRDKRVLSFGAGDGCRDPASALKVSASASRSKARPSLRPTAPTVPTRGARHPRPAVASRAAAPRAARSGAGVPSGRRAAHPPRPDSSPRTRLTVRRTPECRPGCRAATSPRMILTAVVSCGRPIPGCAESRLVGVIPGCERLLWMPQPPASDRRCSSIANSPKAILDELYAFMGS